MAKGNREGEEMASFFTLFGELGVSAFWTRARLGDALGVVERELARRTVAGGLSLDELPLCCPLCGARVWCEDGGQGRTILVDENGALHGDTCAFERKREGEERAEQQEQQHHETT